MMKPIQILTRTLAVGLMLGGAFAQAANISGTVTNKTTGKPSTGDTVELVDVAAGMNNVGKTTTDAKGHYTLSEHGNSSYLVRVTHQGANYFIGAPENGAAGDVGVYDVATKVQGVSIEADVIEIESASDKLQVSERFFVHNLSTPPTTQWSKKSFEVVLPAEATITSSGAQRPGGLPTNIQLDPDGGKGHYAFDFPIQPDDGDKDTLLQISYTLPYSGGKYTFHSVVTIPAENMGVLLPKSMNFAPGAGASFKSVQSDPGMQTYLLKSPPVGQPVEFTVGGTGAVPQTDPNQQAGAQGGMGGGDAMAGGQPGGGIGNPNTAPDPLSKYKWWILGVLALLMVAGAAFLMRAPAGAAPATALPVAPAASKEDLLLATLKDELFKLESDKLDGKISETEYAQAKGAFDIVLKRAMNK
ncbi:carboxypeptidase regulatory-like domain-containing protein [Telmatobacter bradus]|uniref:carboxypeptidase regulatory-like domain-containing protein n=1 Tax=Telmatobacter bradus TaxID=474953 RepID=UPI003B42C1F0